MVGVIGFEPTTPSSRTRCATSHTPISLVRPHDALRQLLRRDLGAGSDGVHQVSALLILALQQRHELRKWRHANSSTLHGSAPSMMIARLPAELLT